MQTKISQLTLTFSPFPCHITITPLFLLIISLLTTSSLCQNCTTCTQLSYYHCTVCYNSCTQIPAQQFQSCQWSYCNYFGFNTTYNCFTYQIANLPQSQCFQKCCNNSPQNYFTVQQLNKCQQISTQNNVIAIASSISIAGLFFLFFCFCYVRRAMRCSCGACVTCQRAFDRCVTALGGCIMYIVDCMCCRRGSNNSNNGRYNNDAIGSVRYMSNQDLITLQSMHWQKQQQPDQTISTLKTDSSCTICLNNNVNTRTKCGHYFHLQCLWEWFHRYPVCPLCKNDKASQCKFYCTSCAVHFVKINLKAHYGLEQILEKLGNTECDECQKGIHL